MTRSPARKRVGKRGSLLLGHGSLVTIRIQGRFNRPGDDVGEIIDNALHDAGLCGCAGPANGYMLVVETITTSDRHGASRDHDRREAARAWIVGSLAASPEQAREGQSEPARD